jgi:Zn-dependent protease with chaperone function
MVLFSYLLTLLLAAACVYLPYLLLTKTGVFALQALALFVGGLAMAVTMLWSLVPRRDKFTPPGPRLTAAGQPRLFAEIERIASALGEAMPEAVYLVADVNAWVARRGGILGFGGRRVMGLGLPLLDVLTVSEFRAVLAHEFGHYYGGDTRLGPWVYAARVTMVRTLVGIGSDSGPMAAVGRVAAARVVHLLVVMALGTYWKVFMRATQLVSRRQECRADELACAVAGSSALIGGLRRIEGLSAALPLFWRSSVTPALQAGCRIPLAEGFAQFTALPKVAAAISDHVEKKLNTARTLAYDSHPPLRDRLAAAASFRGQAQPESSARAVTLFDGIDRLEVQLLETVAPKSKAASLKLVAWDRIAPDVYVPLWRAFVAGHRRVLAEFKVEDLPRVAQDPRDVIAQMRDPKGTLLTRQQRAEVARSLLWTAFTVMLLDHGWELRPGPGENCLQLGEHILNPDKLARDVQSGKLTERDWVAHAEALRIGQLKLAPPAAPGTQ